MSSFASGRSKKRSWADISNTPSGVNHNDQTIMERKRKYMRIKGRVTAVLKDKLASAQKAINENMHSMAGGYGEGSGGPSRPLLVPTPPPRFTRSEIAATVMKAAQDEQRNRINHGGLYIDREDDSELWKILEEDLIQELEKEELMVQEQCRRMEDYNQEFIAQYAGPVGDIAQKTKKCSGEGFDEIPTQSSLVLCPVCQQSNLLQLKAIVFCGCGMRIDTGSSDGLSLEYIGGRLADVLNSHYSTSCSGRPVFETKQLFGGVTNLIMECTTCNKLEIII